MGAILRWEWRRALRERALQVALGAYAVLLGLGIAAGILDARARVEAHGRLLAAEEATLADLARTVADIEAGRVAAPESWLDPRQPGVLGRDAHGGGRPALLPPAAGAFIAVGQSDLLPDELQVTIGPATTFLARAELADPDALSIGRFDAAFVLVYLLPLFLLAVSYDLVAGDRRRGLLALLSAVGASPVRVAAARATARGLAFLAITAVQLGLGWVVAAAVLPGSSSPWPAVLALGGAALYLLFWSALAVACNARPRPPAWNATTLAGIWVALVVMVPAIVNLAVKRLHPAPSRAELILETRAMSGEARARGEALLAGFYGDHPELAGATVDKDDFAANSVIANEYVEQALAPTLARFDDEAAAQRRLVTRAQMFAPPLALASLSSEAAGSAASRHARFVEQVREYHEVYRDFVVPRIFRKATLAPADFAAVPRFRFRELTSAEIAGAALTGLSQLGLAALVAMLLAAWAWRRPIVLAGAT